MEVDETPTGGTQEPVIQQALLSAETAFPHYAQLRDVFAPECLAELRDQLTISRGKVFFITHPFYLESGWYQGHLADVVQGRVNDKNLTDYYEKLGETVPKLLENGVPVILLQEINRLGNNFLEDESAIEAQHNELVGYLNLLGINPDSIFVMYTDRGGPFPLKSKGEQNDRWLEVTKRRLEILKGVGLRVGIVAGREFKPSDGDNFEYYPSADDPDYGWGKTADKVHEGFLLKDYYDEVRNGLPGKHPFQVIRPDHCVGELLRQLAINGIKPGISALTYPDKIGRASDYIEVEYDGRRVFSKKNKRLRELFGFKD